MPGKGPVAGAALAAHPLVRKITFTGSTKAGAAVSAAACANITPSLLELGGVNAFIVFEDADLDVAVRHALEGGYGVKGEACTAASRVLVERSIYDRFADKMAAGVSKLKVGPGYDKNTHIAPLVSRGQQHKVLNHIEIGKSEGAVIAAQSPTPRAPELKDGFYVPATLFRDVTRDMRIVNEEISGPVVALIPFDTYEEAISIANQTEYGLVAGVYTKDMNKAFRAAREIEVGIVFINNYYRNVFGTPLGGAKHSGYGREHCIQTIQEFGQIKSIRFPSGLGVIPSLSTFSEILGE